ncbi:MAG: hypothetical protein RR557_07575 [Bacilli bacterium]
MLITDFYEMVEIKRRRQNKTLQDLANLISKSTVYTSQVIKGHQVGEKADMYRQIIANDLDIAFVEKGEN